MKERPIIFSAPMVRAIIEDRKTQTRRISKNQPIFDGNFWKLNGSGAAWTNGYSKVPVMPCHSLASLCPYGRHGDLLWVRESCRIYGKWEKNGRTKTGKQKLRFVEHASRQVSYEPLAPFKKPLSPETLAFWPRSAIFMPRWASRICLAVTDIYLQRLGEISAEDAIAEGVVPYPQEHKFFRLSQDEFCRQLFFGVLDKIHGINQWRLDDWAWVIHFKRVKNA